VKSRAAGVSRDKWRQLPSDSLGGGGPSHVEKGHVGQGVVAGAGLSDALEAEEGGAYSDHSPCGVACQHSAPFLQGRKLP
jgi:hypothetical protein